MNVIFDSVPKVITSLGIVIGGWCALEMYHQMQSASAAIAVVEASLAEAGVLSDQRDEVVRALTLRTKEAVESYSQATSAAKQGKLKEATELKIKGDEGGKRSEPDLQRNDEIRKRQEAKSIELARQMKAAESTLDSSQRLGYFLFGGLCLGVFMTCSGINGWVRQDALAKASSNVPAVRRLAKKRGNS